MFYYPGRPAPVSIVILCRFCCYGMTLCAKFFFRASNGIFGKVGRIASEEVLISLQLLNIKCLPILLYSLEVCNLSRRNLQSLDFTVNTFFTKLFNANNMHIVNTANSILHSNSLVWFYQSDWSSSSQQLMAVRTCLPRYILHVYCMPTAYRYMLDIVIWNVSCCKTFSLILDICTLVKFS